VLTKAEKSTAQAAKNACFADRKIAVGRPPHEACLCKSGAATGQQELRGKANYFIGTESAKCRTDVPT